MMHTVAKIGLYIGLIVQSCLISTALATPLDISPQQTQHIDLLSTKQGTLYTERLVPDYVDRALLRTANSADTLLSHIPFERHSNKAANPMDKWRSWQGTNQLNQGNDEAPYYDEYPHRNYEDTYSDTASITVKSALQLYVNSAGDKLNQDSMAHQGSSSYPGDSLGLVKKLLKLTLDEEQAEQLLSITEPWQDDSGIRHFSLFGIGDFVMENTPVYNNANGHIPPKTTYRIERYYEQAAATNRGRQASKIEHLTLKERLYELIDDTIGWPMLYLLIIVTGIWLLTVSIFKLLHFRQAQ